MGGQTNCLRVRESILHCVMKIWQVREEAFWRQAGRDSTVLSGGNRLQGVVRDVAFERTPGRETRVKGLQHGLKSGSSRSVLPLGEMTARLNALSRTALAASRMSELFRLYRVKSAGSAPTVRQLSRKT